MAAHSQPEQLRRRMVRLGEARGKLRASLRQAARAARQALPAEPRTSGGSSSRTAG